MNYGLVSKCDAVRYATVICDVIGHGKNNAAVSLCVETAAAETLLGEYKDPTPTSAGTGLTQVDLGTFEWLRNKYKNGRYASALLREFGVDLSRTVYQELRTSPLLAMLFCRLRYLAVSESIPATREERADYWKKYYNTSAGKGTPEDYIEKCRRAGVDALFTQ
ncbi:hypothetical protein AN237_26040 (plasmid) [Raoultella ornithinolytica]|uniref:hypothetical protein n=1 Tax=Raoultella ornithinolytica TaxID=54291 RepID=UPI00084A2992|nr:hypothetical protein [Raoultella ornithinolytica]AOO60017.1 hypothetical protein AN237_26040 [Raoultella ornithinolytica]